MNSRRDDACVVAAPAGHAVRRVWSLRSFAALLACAGGMALAQEPAPAVPVFDVHVHLREGDASVARYRADAESAGLTLAGLGAMWFGGPHQARGGTPDELRARNDALIDFAADHPDMVPIGSVHPYDGRAALDELERIAGRGVRMIKLHAHTQQFAVADPRVLELVRKAGELDVVVLVDNAGIVAGDSEDLFNLAVQAPKTRFVFAHIGGLNFRFWNILPLARTAAGFGMDNIHFDISAIVLLAAGSPIEAEFIWTLRNVGIDRVLLGSDYPQISLGRTVEALERMELTPEEKAKIRYLNARALLRLRTADGAG
jgi:uncharacterized protein